MNPRILCWTFFVVFIGSCAATDIPFIFGDSNLSCLENYTLRQLENVSSLSSELAGVPSVSAPADNETLAFPVTGGGSTSGGMAEKKVGDLKKALNTRVEPDNAKVHEEALVLALKYPGDHTIDQICSIYSYLKNGDDSKKGWGYVADPRGMDYFMYANESLKVGERATCVGGGDCDDFAILMSALVESIGGTTRIILARNNSTGGHAYAEVYLGRLDSRDSHVADIMTWLEKNFDIDKIYTHIDTATRDVWLNLDWSADHPGGPFYLGDKHVVLCIRDTFGKIPLKVPESSTADQAPVPRKKGHPHKLSLDSLKSEGIDAAPDGTEVSSESSTGMSSHVSVSGGFFNGGMMT